MTTTQERVTKLEIRVTTLETWAGPGQAEALSAGVAGIRAELQRFRREQGAATAALQRDVAVLKTDVAGLKTDVAVLKADMSDVKATVHEILRRLPAA